MLKLPWPVTCFSADMPHLGRGCLAALIVMSAAVWSGCSEGGTDPAVDTGRGGAGSSGNGGRGGSPPGGAAGSGVAGSGGGTGRTCYIECIGTQRCVDGMIYESYTSVAAAIPCGTPVPTDLPPCPEPHFSRECEGACDSFGRDCAAAGGTGDAGAGGQGGEGGTPGAEAGQGGEVG